MSYYTNIHGMPCMQSLLCVATLGGPEWVQVICVEIVILGVVRSRSIVFY